MPTPDQKKRILLASVLKPVDEPRMFERMAMSLAANGFEVFIAGFPPSSHQSINRINFLPHQKFRRISIARIRVRFKILGMALSVKPDFFIISTHELIGVAILFKLLTGRKIIYDVQENYWRNIIHTKVWPKLIRPLIAFAVRWKEWITSPFFFRFLLAEKCYLNELSFSRRKAVVIENKCRVPAGFLRRPLANRIQLLFTGTIAESTGIVEVINLTRKLHAVDPKIELNIVGQCIQEKTLEWIEKEISRSPFIKINEGKDFVSHEKIYDAISLAHFGIVFYPPSPHVENKVPSKLYEYLACQLPILLQNNKQWADLCKHLDSAIVIDFNTPDVTAILAKMNEKRFFSRQVTEAGWATEEKKLLSVFQSA